MATTPQPPATSPIGRDTLRVDGPRKVTGLAQYTSDFNFPACCTPFRSKRRSRMANCSRSILRRLRRCPAYMQSFIARISARSFARLPRRDSIGICVERRPPFEDDVDPLLRPVHCARCSRHVRGRQSCRRCSSRNLRERKTKRRAASCSGRRSRRGLDRPLDRARDCKVSAAMPTPRSPVRRSSSTKPTSRHLRRTTRSSCTQPPRYGRGETLTLYDSTQGVVNLRSVLAQMFGLPKENVRVITKFLGSGFGGKLWPWTHVPLAAAAARQLGKPVRLVLSRKMMFQTVGHRPRTQQRVRLGATREGKLVSLHHDYIYHLSMLDALPRGLRRGDAVPIQRSEFARDLWARQAKHRRGSRHARPRRSTRTLRHRIGNE